MQLEHHLKIMKSKNKEEKEVKLIDPYKLNIDSEQYFRYNGSLSVPPCTEGIIWNVFKKVSVCVCVYENILQTSSKFLLLLFNDVIIVCIIVR